ncbi:hypothetical protein GCM10010357_08170 [Streptomyces luteireticuli]|uniref:Alpha/beta fold hydrolase n=1 Tax=Streptomyces luteireticuli TaxID=173858 RepID=A0ABN0YBD2_9ACTN
MSEQQTLQYRTDGPEDAPVLVLGPALGTTWHMWDRQIPELIRTWRVLRFDLPGHGGAPALPAVTVGDLSDRLLATLDALGVESFGYAGCCIGGALGADLALRHPHRLASLAFVGAAARFGTAESWGVRASEARSHGLGPAARTAPEHWFTPGFAAAQPAIVDWAVQMVRTTDVPCYSAACEALAAFDARPGLGRVDVPTLVLVGAEDQVTPPADARVLVAGIHDARLAVVPGTRHLAPVEQPAAVTDLLVRHFTTTWRQPSARRAAAPGPLPQASPVPDPGRAAEPAENLGAAPAPQGVFGPPPTAAAGQFRGPEGAYAGGGPGDTPAAGVPYAGAGFGAEPFRPGADTSGAGTSGTGMSGVGTEADRTGPSVVGMPHPVAPDAGRSGEAAPDTPPVGTKPSRRAAGTDDWPGPERTPGTGTSPAQAEPSVRAAGADDRSGGPAEAPPAGTRPLEDVATTILPRTPSAGPPPAGIPAPAAPGTGAEAADQPSTGGVPAPAVTAAEPHYDGAAAQDATPPGGASHPATAAGPPLDGGTPFRADEPTTDLFVTSGPPRPAADLPETAAEPYGEGAASPEDGVPSDRDGAGEPHARAASLRRRVLGDSHVDRAEAEAAADPFSRDFEEFANRATWGDTWSRPGLDLRTRSLLTLTALTVGGHLDELAAHARAALRLGVSPEEIKETLQHAALYAGLPAARAAFAAVRPEVTAHVTAEDGAPERRP